MKKCLNCGKLHDNKKFCSRKCTQKYFKENQISAFYDPRLKRKSSSKGGKNTHIKYPNQSRENAKKSIITNKRNKTGIYGISKEQRQKTAKKSHITNKRNKTGIYALTYEQHVKNAKKATITNRKNGTSFCFDKKLQSRGGKIGGKIGGRITAKVLREKRNIKFNGIYFASYGECEIGICIYYQIEKLKIDKNYQVNVGFKSFDFLISQFNCFIEYHPYNQLYDKGDTNLIKYYNRRRKILDNNGYKNHNLIIIK